MQIYTCLCGYKLLTIYIQYNVKVHIILTAFIPSLDKQVLCYYLYNGWQNTECDITSREQIVAGDISYSTVANSPHSTTRLTL